MGFEGMDPEFVRSVAQRLQAQAEDLRGIAGTVESLVTQALNSWPGSDAQEFGYAWHTGHRGRLTSAAEGVATRAADLHAQVNQQLEASAMGGAPLASGNAASSSRTAAGLLAAGLAGVWQGANKMWDRTSPLRTATGVIDGLKTFGLYRTWRSSEQFFYETFSAFSLENRTQNWLKFGRLATDLGALGAVVDTWTLVDGIQSGDDSKKLAGGVGLGSAVMGLAPPLLPVALVAAGTYEVGSRVLPVGDEEYGGSYDMALAQHFGSSYDPANPTPEQAAWGMARYSGPLGLLNSIGDGVQYKAEKNFGLW